MLEFLIENPVLTALMTGFLAAIALYITWLGIRLTIWSVREIKGAFNDYRTAKAIDDYCANVARSYREAQTQRRHARECDSNERSKDPLISALRALNAGTHLRRYRNDIGEMGFVFEGFEPGFRGKGRGDIRPEEELPEWVRPEFFEGRGS